jgi:hypothetical protein
MPPCIQAGEPDEAQAQYAGGCEGGFWVVLVVVLFAGAFEDFPPQPANARVAAATASIVSMAASGGRLIRAGLLDGWTVWGRTLSSVNSLTYERASRHRDTDAA